MDKAPMHTPPPWRIDPDATFIGDRYVGTDSADIALMADWSIADEPEQWANARLIAAAPDLLDDAESAVVDLSFLRRAIDEGDPKAELLLRVDDIVRRHTAVIAKATKP